MGTDQKDTDRIVEAILYLYTEGRRVTKEIARHHGLTGPQVTAVKMLEGLGNLSLSALSERMSAKNSTVTGIVDRMERDGLVQRVRSEADRRVVLIRLTEDGLTLARAIPLESLQIFTSALASLTVEERKELTRLLLKVTDQVAKEVEAAEARVLEAES
jgi:DNA-binding MarR family transcriptional regulator